MEKGRRGSMDGVKEKWCKLKKMWKLLVFLLVITAAFAFSLLAPREALADSSEIRGTFILNVGSNRQISSHGGSAPYNWSSSNPSVARVVPDRNNSAYAHVYGLQPGMALITLNSLKFVPTWGGGDIEAFRETWTVSVTNEAATITPTSTPTPLPVSVTEVKLSKSAAKLVIGKTLNLTAAIRPTNASTTLTWSSSNSSVAAVNANGQVTGKKAGTATITVTTANGKKDTCKITVTAPAPSAIKLNASKITLLRGKTTKLTYSLSPANAAGKITFSSSKPSVAVVNGSGIITAKSSGTAVITAKYSSKVYARCTVTVPKDPSSVTLNKTKAELIIGKSLTLKASVKPSGAGTVYTWTSSKPKIASVNSKGTVTAKKAGTATITVKTSNGKKAVCKVTVKAPAPKAIKLNASAITLVKGRSAKLTYSLSPSNAAGKITWSSGKPSVAVVDSNGKVTAKAAGTATITAKYSSKVYAKCKITVPASTKATAISLNGTSGYVNIGSTLQISAAVTPSYTTDKVIWSTSNASVASVSSKGKVKGLSNGSAVITAKAGNVSASFTVAVVSGTVFDISKGRILVEENKILYNGRSYSYNTSAGAVIVQSDPKTSNEICLAGGKAVLANVHLKDKNIYTANEDECKNVILELMRGTSNSIEDGFIWIQGWDYSHTFTIQGTGSLEITSIGSPAISGHNITIKEGNLTLRVLGDYQSVIGGWTCKNITIMSGAHVKAYGGYNAIGSGKTGDTPVNISVAEGSLVYVKNG